MQVDRRRFRTAKDYEAALRDSKIIDGLEKKYKIKDLDSATKADLDKVYMMLSDGSLKFESALGNDFDDKITELREEIANRPDTKKRGLFSAKNGKNVTHGGGAKGGLAKGAVAKGNVAKGGEENGGAKKQPTKLEDMSPAMQAEVKRQLKKRERRRKLTVSTLLIAAVASLGYYIIYYVNSSKHNDEYKEISNLVGSNALQGDTPTTVTATINNETRTLTVLPKYETLYKSNNKLIGWIKIADTNIDYPVMQTTDNEYYLNHNFDQEESKAGALFLDYQCDVVSGCDNYIIYGHHLSSGGMFSKLSDYQSKSYYEKHKYINFDTIYEEGTYQVMFAFRSRVYDSDQVVFKYYQFINATSEEEFTSYMNEMRKDSFYDTGVEAYYGDQLLTLSTCDYNEKNGRFVVVAKKIY
ncbi:MAG TPA: SrtB family sortase [Lachnospiraceae bacterium]|nr:SrtB family sortase [Lachnospiraceae bacterium]